ncbi:MAG: GlxA family transcriptional regulator [Silicimonas sp.]|nr:GlxA family transcriptional regulator [Silicimonas sp.]
MDEASRAPFRVGLLPLPGFPLLSYACTVEPLRAANLLSGQRLYEVVHLGETAPVPSSGAAGVADLIPISAATDLDLVLVVAGGDPFGVAAPELFEGLRALDRAGVQLGGVSGGAVILAKAGLMEGRRMTVHWEHAEALSKAFPSALIERRLFVIDRDRVTCGGGTAPLDLMHALIAAERGSVFARLVSDWFLHTDIRNATAPQRGELSARLGSHSPHLVEAVSVMENHVADPLSLGQVAMLVGVTARHLNRLFTEALGQSAMAYYRGLRLEVARRLIRGTALTVAEVAETTGFATAGHFSNAYKQVFGLRPQADRRQKSENAEG